jgi:hypothetical protein
MAQEGLLEILAYVIGVVALQIQYALRFDKSPNDSRQLIAFSHRI